MYISITTNRKVVDPSTICRKEDIVMKRCDINQKVLVYLDGIRNLTELYEVTYFHSIK